MTIEEYKKRNKKHSNKYLYKIMFTILITLICLILLKSNDMFKEKFNKYVFNDHTSFVQINNFYNKYLKGIIPFKSKEQQVFNEKINYTNISRYLDGSKLTVSDNYLVPVLENGMVIYIGEKEDYGNTVIIEQINGLEVWYSNLKNISVNMYDYVDKGSLIGEVSNELYIVIQENGKFLNYEDVF